MATDLRHRTTTTSPINHVETNYKNPSASSTPRPPLQSRVTNHPAGEVKHGLPSQILRAVVSLGWFLISCLCIHTTQWLGAPLYYWDKSYFYAWMALSKQSFAIITIMLTQCFSPTTIRLSGDSSMRGQFSKAKDGSGLLETRFPERMVLISNHQIYTDWIYLWYTAYASRMHGAIYIILKESLKYIPLIGWGMQFNGFVFMSRKWDTDKPRLQHRMRQLSTKHAVKVAGTGGIVKTDASSGLDPMWMIIFPEGTNYSANTKKKSVAWSEKSGIPDMRHQLLPRATGMFFCLNELKETVEYVYDCTVAYEGSPKTGYAQDYFSLRSTFLQGRPPKSVNFYWRRFAIKDLPLDDQKAFEKWILNCWREKDDLLETFYNTGRFPADEDSQAEPYVESLVKLRSWAELLQPYVVVITAALLLNIGRMLWTRFISRPWIALRPGAE
ncbi:hypothetical protein LTR05_006956 [Lithohypha guttulata]|uniref:Phospholipid/glycerol acyltransferase domain-containing protein n=1 Tax=Lithohypha guttulata TaxID=1690604 RepID=A0AAN7Y590_9EURO|nr:hypothetical protein LTR05_006956 [Lithohypha guttulata]